MTKILTNDVTKPHEVPSEANLRILADLCRYVLTMFLQDQEQIDFKLVYGVLLCQNLIYARVAPTLDEPYAGRSAGTRKIFLSKLIKEHGLWRCTGMLQ